MAQHTKGTANSALDVRRGEATRSLERGRGLLAGWGHGEESGLCPESSQEHRRLCIGKAPEQIQTELSGCHVEGERMKLGDQGGGWGYTRVKSQGGEGRAGTQALGEAHPGQGQASGLRTMGQQRPP